MLAFTDATACIQRVEEAKPDGGGVPIEPKHLIENQGTVQVDRASWSLSPMRMHFRMDGRDPPLTFVFKTCATRVRFSRSSSCQLPFAASEVAVLSAHRRECNQYMTHLVADLVRSASRYLSDSSVGSRTCVFTQYSPLMDNLVCDYGFQAVHLIGFESSWKTGEW